MSFQVKAEKMIAKPASEVFRGLKEGRLFMNCSGDSRSLEIDFRVGGKYKVDFKSHQVTNFGEFLEIIPNKKIVFTWCQTFGADQKPDSQVAIELFEDGPKTRLVLLHTGFKTKESADMHEGGWCNGVADFGDELQLGRLRMVREFKAPLAELFNACKNPETFFAFMGDLPNGKVDFKVGGKYQVPNDNDGIKGEFLEIVPNEKIVMSWLMGCTGPLDASKVTILFDQKKDGTSLLKLVHEGLMTQDDQHAHRYGWEVVMEKMAKTLGRGSR